MMVRLGLPALFEQHPESTGLFKQRYLSRNRILRAVNPCVVVVTPDHPLIRRAAPGILPMTS